MFTPALGPLGSSEPDREERQAQLAAVRDPKFPGSQGVAGDNQPLLRAWREHRRVQAKRQRGVLPPEPGGRDPVPVEEDPEAERDRGLTYPPGFISWLPLLRLVTDVLSPKEMFEGPRKAWQLKPVDHVCLIRFDRSLLLLNYRLFLFQRMF